MTKSPVLDEILRGQLCAGCGLCASISNGSIEMGEVRPGYRRPIQTGPVSHETEFAIRTSCPGIAPASWPREAEVHPYWGPWTSILTGHALDPAVRHAGSSGGAISALLRHALSSGMAERVIQVAADPADPTRNIVVCSSDGAQILDASGSRYTSSSPLEVIEQELSKGGRMVFVGKPCDVSALRKLATIDPRVDRHVVLTISFFCGGMPSHDGVLRILAAMGLGQQEVVAFRYRGNGWPGRASATSRDGKVVTMSYEESWGGFLSKEVQFRCKICPDAVGGVADIACADAWYGGESGYPQFDEREGRSLIVGRTPRGEALLKDARAAGAIATDVLPIEEIALMQPSQARRKRLVAARMAALVVTGQPRPRVNGLQVAAAAMRSPLADSLKNFAGTLRRILAGRR